MKRDLQLSNAFASAIEATKRQRTQGMRCTDGSSADDKLAQLERELVAEQGRAQERGFVDKEWFQRTVRWMVDWVPETDLDLLAALGQIVRVKPSTQA